MNQKCKNENENEAQIQEYLSESTKQNLMLIYRKILKQTVIDFGFSTKIFNISHSELCDAVTEASIDLAIMKMRRKPENGISHGKFSGIFCFRLSRHKIVNVILRDDQIGDTIILSENDRLKSEEEIKNIKLKREKIAYRLQDVVAIKFSCVAFNPVGLSSTIPIEDKITQIIPDVSILKELIYVLNRRHVNQEMLGMLFDMTHKMTPLKVSK